MKDDTIQITNPVSRIHERRLIMEVLFEAVVN